MAAAIPFDLSRRPLIAMVSDRVRYGRTEEERTAGLVAAVAQAAQAGVDLIQIRERGLDDGRLAALVRQAVAAADGTSARIVVNDRPDVAMAAGAHGVHLPASSVPSRRVRAIVPPGFVVGRSVHGESEAVEEQAVGACDYLFFGTVFPSRGKPAGHPVAGLEGLARVCRSVSMPILAIGGVTHSRVREVAGAGAAGFAAITLFAPDGRDLAGDLAADLREIRTAYTGVC